MPILDPKAGRMGLVFTVDDEEFVRKMDKYNQRLDAAAQATDRATKVMSKSQKDSAKDTETASEKQIKQLRNLRWEIITVMFYFRTASRIIASAWENVNASVESAMTRSGLEAVAKTYGRDAQQVVTALKSITDGALSTRQALLAVQQGMIADQGRFVGEYAQLWQVAETASLVTGGETIDLFGELVEAIDTADAELLDSTTTYTNAQEALEEYADSQNSTVDALTKAEKTQVLLNEVYNETQTVLDNGGQSALEYRRSVEGLTGAWQDLVDTFVQVGGVTDAVGGFFDFLNKRLRTAAELFVLMQASYEGFKSAIRTTVQTLPKWVAPDILREEDAPGIRDIYEAFRQGYGDTFQRGAEILGTFNEQGDETINTLNRIQEEASEGIEFDDAFSQFLDYENMVRDHQQRLEEIDADYQDDRLDAWDTYQDKLADASRIATRDRARAIRSYNRRVAQLRRRQQQQEQGRLEKHLQQMEHERQKFRMRQMQSERLYHYEREQLVAEGDVLAIEDLDARYELEQQAQQEQHDLRLRQMEESFQLQQRLQEQAMQEQLRNLQIALQEQLHEIEMRRQEREREAEQGYQEDLAEAKEAQRERRAEEQRAYQRRLEDWAAHWAEMVATTTLESQQVIEVLRNYFGPGAVADSIIQSFVQRANQYLDLQVRVRDAIGSGGGGGGSPYVPLPPLPPAGNPFTTPSYNAPNTMTPQSVVINGGNPITVRGEGDFANADMTEVGRSVSDEIINILRDGARNVRAV
jgi:hypothetical protein